MLLRTTGAERMQKPLAPIRVAHQAIIYGLCDAVGGVSLLINHMLHVSPSLCLYHPYLPFFTFAGFLM